MWHILKKIPEKFDNHRHKAYILSIVHGLVYFTKSLQEFEENWHTMLAHYELQEHGWLAGFYDERNRLGTMLFEKFILGQYVNHSTK